MNDRWFVDANVTSSEKNQTINQLFTHYNSIDMPNGVMVENIST